MIKKDVKWNWREKWQKAFEKLKERFILEPVLLTPDLDIEMRVEIDILDFAMGEVLSMKCEDEKQRSVAYISKSLNEAERNYEIHDKEMLAITRYLEIWRYFLEEAKNEFKIWILYESSEVELKTGQISLVFFKI